MYVAKTQEILLWAYSERKAAMKYLKDKATHGCIFKDQVQVIHMQIP